MRLDRVRDDLEVTVQGRQQLGLAGTGRHRGEAAQVGQQHDRVQPAHVAALDVTTENLAAGRRAEIGPQDRVELAAFRADAEQRHEMRPQRPQEGRVGVREAVGRARGPGDAGRQRADRCR